MLRPPPGPTLFPYTTLFRSPPATGRAPLWSISRAAGIVSTSVSRRRTDRCGGSRPEKLSAITASRSEEHTSELQSLRHLVCRLLLEKKKIYINTSPNRRQRE